MPTAEILELPLQERAERALRSAVEKVVRENARLGLPIYIWRDGKVVALAPEEALLLMNAEASSPLS